MVRRRERNLLQLFITKIFLSKFRVELTKFWKPFPDTPSVRRWVDRARQHSGYNFVLGERVLRVVVGDNSCVSDEWLEFMPRFGPTASLRRWAWAGLVCVHDFMTVVVAPRQLSCGWIRSKGLTCKEHAEKDRKQVGKAAYGIRCQSAVIMITVDTDYCI